LLSQTSSGQAGRSRSADYLFASTARDVRALWLNPAGLAVSTEASIFGEFVLERPIDSELRLAQWSLAFNSRGFSFGYQRDRFGEDPNTGTFRFAVAVPFRNGAIGGAFSFYRGNAIDTTQTWDRGIDLGLRYGFGRLIDLGLVVRNIGRPVLRDSIAPLVSVLSAALEPLPTHLWLAVEASATERLSDSGWNMGYRAGFGVSTGGTLPFSLMSSLDFDSDFAVDQWVVGLAVGGSDRALAIGSGGIRSPRDRLERLSLTGVASRELGGAR
jgi:hypothetical protein